VGGGCGKQGRVLSLAAPLGGAKKQNKLTNRVRNQEGKGDQGFTIGIPALPSTVGGGGGDGQAPGQRLSWGGKSVDDIASRALNLWGGKGGTERDSTSLEGLPRDKVGHQQTSQKNDPHPWAVFAPGSPVPDGPFFPYARCSGEGGPAELAGRRDAKGDQGGKAVGKTQG